MNPYQANRSNQIIFWTIIVIAVMAVIVLSSISKIYQTFKENAQATRIAIPTVTTEALETIYQKGLAYMNIGRWFDAKRELDIVFETNPNYKDVQTKLIEVQTKLSELNLEPDGPKSATPQLTSTPNRANLTQGMVAYYPFNGDAKDESGNEHNGIVYGATLTTDRFGSRNSAYTFDGIDDYIKVRADHLPTTERTISLWFYANTVNKPALFAYGGDGECGTSWFMGINNTPHGLNTFQMQAHCEVNRITASYSKQPVKEWYHWVITTSMDGTKVYLNGSRVATNDKFVVNTVVQGKDMALGVAVNTSGVAPYIDMNVNYFDGILDDVGIWNRALSDEEILELYSNGL